jgi:hypothetical protein
MTGFSAGRPGTLTKGKTVLQTVNTHAGIGVPRLAPKRLKSDVELKWMILQ